VGRGLWLALLILLLLPVVELWVLVGIGRLAGFWITVALLALSGIAGAWLVRTEGRRVWRAAQMRLQAGEMPGHAVLDGLCVLLGAVLLIVPGFVTDAAGLVLLLPFTRPRVRRWLLRWLERRIRGGTWFYFRRW